MISNTRLPRQPSQLHSIVSNVAQIFVEAYGYHARFGIDPNYGVFIEAVDALTGKIPHTDQQIWLNLTTLQGALRTVRLALHSHKQATRLTARLMVEERRLVYLRHAFKTLDWERRLAMLGLGLMPRTVGPLFIDVWALQRIILPPEEVERREIQARQQAKMVRGYGAYG